jgi:hypothetical protein
LNLEAFAQAGEWEEWVPAATGPAELGERA